MGYCVTGEIMVIPVITLDGLSGSGKGTYSQMLAKALGWHYLDSGALFRAVGWSVLHYQVDYQDNNALATLLSSLDVVMYSSPKDGHFQLTCDGRDITHEIRSESVSSMASKSAKIQLVRDFILSLNRGFRKSPGLVADGRDMGTVVFPDAALKFYLEADTATRAQRRQVQLKAKGISVSLRDVQEELMRRDERDQSRDIAPAVPADDVIRVSTVDLSIDQVFDQLMQHVHCEINES